MHHVCIANDGVDMSRHKSRGPTVHSQLFHGHRFVIILKGFCSVNVFLIFTLSNFTVRLIVFNLCFYANCFLRRFHIFVYYQGDTLIN